MLGARFRLHGREAATGLDCVGLIAAALKAGGFEGAVPSGYALRGGDPRPMLDAALRRVNGDAPGDVLLMRTGPGQWHLGIRTTAGVIHADAGLRRVVERPGAMPWPIAGAWRWDGEGRDGDVGADDGGDVSGRPDRRCDR
jgi:hypothetical protein